MAITFPPTIPASPAPRSIQIAAESRVGIQASPFTGEQTVYAHQGEWLEAQVSLPSLDLADAAAWVAFLLKLNGVEGTFLMGPTVRTGATPRGTWLSGSPPARVSGAHAARVKTVTLKDFTSGATGLEMDWIQFGSGASASLHQVVQDFAASAGGAATVEIWPRTRAALADDDAFVVNSAVGLWRLKDNRRDWSIEEAQSFGISFACRQA